MTDVPLTTQVSEIPIESTNQKKKKRKSRKIKQEQKEQN